jgi:Mor family transcriptional regulator
MTDQGMDRALREKCDAIEALFEKADEDEVATRYRVGALVQEVRDTKGTYGEKGVEKIASKLKRHHSTLYRCAAVADLGPWRDIRPKAKEKGLDGHTLTWAHWLELSRVPKVWRRWHTKALAEAWTSRELGAQLDASLAETAPAKDEASDTTTEALADTLRAVRRYEGEVAGAFAALLDRIERLPSRERSKDVPELLARGMDLLEAAHAKSGALLVRVRKLTGEGRAARSNTVTGAN